MKNILITGATGFIGSHMRVSLIEQGYDVVGLDTCERSSHGTIERIEKLVGKTVEFHQCSIGDKEVIEFILEKYEIDCVIHFAAFKAVGESCEKPGLYFDNNISGTISLLYAMEKQGVSTMIFSSSATVYDGNYPAPYSENSQTGSPSNPYGASKYQIELLLDTYCEHSDLSVISLRYFNPVGAHLSGIIGEDIRYSNKSLVSFVMRTLLGERKELAVFGGDWPTNDGSCIRDYITVNDLVEGHIAAMRHIEKTETQIRNDKINLGTGVGVSVIEFLEIVKEATGKDLPYSIIERRQGDLGVVFSNADKAKTVLGREAKESLQVALAAEWEFVKNSI